MIIHYKNDILFVAEMPTLTSLIFIIPSTLQIYGLQVVPEKFKPHCQIFI